VRFDRTQRHRLGAASARSTAFGLIGNARGFSFLVPTAFAFECDSYATILGYSSTKLIILKISPLDCEPKIMNYEFAELNLPYAGTIPYPKQQTIGSLFFYDLRVRCACCQEQNRDTG
jgi:hypothetical protein